MTTSGTMTSTAAPMAKAFAAWLVKRRHRLTFCVEASPGCLGTYPPCRSGDAPNQQTGQRIDDQGHEEERKSDFDQRTQVEVASSFAEFVGDDAGHGIAGGEERFGDFRPIADDHG